MRILAAFLLSSLLAVGALQAADRAPEPDPPVAFQEGDGEESGSGREEPDYKTLELPPPEGAEAGELLDEPGNFRMKFPAGWVILVEAPDEESVFRGAIGRTAKNINGEAYHIEIFRYRIGDAGFFTRNSPSDAFETLEKQTKFWDQLYGENATAYLQPELIGGRYLGGVDKSIGFEMRSHRLDESQKLREIEERIRRGDKTAVRPDWADYPFVSRGRLAMLSPYIYVVRATSVFRQLADNQTVVAEIDQIMEDFEFLDAEAKPPALSVGREKIGNTFADPELADKRKVEVQHVERKQRTYEFELSFTLPPGWAALTDDEALQNAGYSSQVVSAVVYAQDDAHNWVRVVFAHTCIRELGNRSLSMPERQCGEWKANWEGQATRTEFPRKEDRIRMGHLKGKGWEEVPGMVGNFPVRFRALCADEGAFRHLVEIEMRGNTREDIEEFERDLKYFERSIRLRD